MKKICMLLIAAAINAVMAVDVDEGVLVLTDDNFDAELAKHQFLLVEFYAPWCGHCKKLAPEYSEAALVLQKNDPPLSLAKVDATEQKKLAERFGIQGFPTLVWFNKGERQEYTGGRSKDTIVQWVLKKSGPASTAVTCAALKSKIEESKFVIAYFGEEGTPLYTDAHIAYANSEDKIQFVHNNEASCAEEYVSSTPSIVFFRKFETPVNVYSGKPDKESLVSFVKPLTVPTVFEFSEEEIEAVFGQQQPTAILFRSKADKDAKFVSVFEEAAKTHKGKTLFSLSGVTDGIQEKLAEFMGVTEDQLPTLRVIIPKDMKKYACDTKPADLTVEFIGQWLQDVLDGKFKPSLKSEEPVPNNGPLTIVVGKNFDEIVRDPTKDVLVKFYAPWCGHCKKLAPVWDELAEFYKDQKDLVIAKFDSTLNEAEGVEIKGYPTLIFYPKDNKNGVSYDGERELEDFKKWLSQHSSVLKASSDQHKEEL